MISTHQFSEQIVVGISGISVQSDELNLGEGLVLRKTYAHLMNPYLMAFQPAAPNSYHPAPWKAVTGGMGIDIEAELVIPNSYNTSKFEGRMELIAWLVELLRIWVSPKLAAPVICNMTFADAASAPDGNVAILPLEVTPRSLHLSGGQGEELSEELVEWVTTHWKSSMHLLNHKRFATAIAAIRQAHFIQNPGLTMVLLWGALEGLFHPDGGTGIKFQTTSLLASYLRPYGSERRQLQSDLATLYKKRSVSAHGGEDVDWDAAAKSMQVLREALIKMITDGSVPSGSNLRDSLLGSD